MYRFSAPITMGNASASLAEGARAIDGGETELGLGALERSDSSAVAVLLALARHAGLNGKTLKFVDMPRAVGSLAKLYGVDTLLAPVVIPG